MNDLLKKQRIVGAVDDVNIDSAGDNHEIVFGGPVLITRVGFIVTTAVANATGTVEIDVRRRPVAGADANHVELCTLTVTTTTTRAAGAVVYKDCYVADTNGETAEDGSLRFEAPNSEITVPITGYDAFIIPMGQSLELDVDATNVADSGAGRYFIEYIDLPLTGVFASQTNVFEDVTNQ